MQENKQEKSPIKQNILRYLAQKGVSAYEFYKESGVTRGILQQNNGISEDNIARFLAYAPDVNIEMAAHWRRSHALAPYTTYTTYKTYITPLNLRHTTHPPRCSRRFPCRKWRWGTSGGLRALCHTGVREQRGKLPYPGVWRLHGAAIL